MNDIHKIDYPINVVGTITSTGTVNGRNISVDGTTLDSHVSNYSNPHDVTKTQVGLSNVNNTLMKFNASTSPLVTSDQTYGYSIGSIWINTVTYQSYICSNASTGNAQWNLLTIQSTSDVPQGTNLYYTNSLVASYLSTIEGVPYGLATLDANGKVSSSQLNITPVIYQGRWNASTNSPLLQSGVGIQGYYYVVSTGGSTLIDGVSLWVTSDWIVFNGTTWDKVNNNGLVSSVAGRIGAITLSPSDITGLSTTYVPEGTNLYFTNALQ